MRVLQRCRHLFAVTHHLIDRQPTLWNDIGETFSLHELHDDEWVSVGRPHFVDGADVWMIQLRGVLRFAPEPRLQVGIAAERNLDGNGSPQLEIAREVDLAHPTGTDETLDLAVPNYAARHRDGRLLDESAGMFVRGKQTLHFRTDGCLVAARCV